MKLERKFKIELLEEHNQVNYYSIKFEGETLSEFEKFLSKNKTKHFEDLSIIITRLEKIGENGAEERYFRYAGTKKDRTSELPSHLDTSKLRLYCIRLSEQIVLLGYGGLKKTRTYNEDPLLNKCVETLQKIDSVIKQKEGTREIIRNGKILLGKLSLSIIETK